MIDYKKNLIFTVIGILLALLFSEVFLELVVFLSPKKKNLNIYRTCGDCSYLYEHIPGSVSINSHGLRGEEILSSNGKKAKRLLVLGDSVSFGVGVKSNQTFPALLNERLKGRGIEVLNAGVSGYSTYNEVRLFSDKLMALKPDYVILQFCLNDISDPRMHLNAYSRIEIPIPDEAVPNTGIHEKLPDHTSGILRNMFWLRSFALFEAFSKYTLNKQAQWNVRNLGIEKDSRFWSTYVTGEIALDMQPLLDYESPEWRWLRRQFDIIDESAKKIGAQLIFLFVPVAYQLEHGYPLHPEELFHRHSRERGIPFIDPLAELSRYPQERMYIMNSLPGTHGTTPDVWHFSAEGHEKVAGIIDHRLFAGDLRS